MNADLSILKLRNKNNLEESDFKSSYKKLASGGFEELVEAQKIHLLKIALLFLNSDKDQVRRFGYAIILKYTILSNDYIPLYNVSIALGYAPVSELIEKRHQPELSMNRSELTKAYQQSYIKNFHYKDDATIRSKGQMQLNSFVQSHDSFTIVAPTSYGKSELLFKKVRSNIRKKVCIIVPSKALLSQTKKSLLSDEYIRVNFLRVLTHPEMYRNDDYFLAVLTQERLLRLLQKNPDLKLDTVLIDEAHNLLVDDSRSRLLAKVIMILRKRNPQISMSFFTPFIADASSLEIIGSTTTRSSKKVDEYMKIEKFIYTDFTNKKSYLYDQFLNLSFPLEGRSYTDEQSYISVNKSAKNLVYLNRPQQAEVFSLSYSDNLDTDLSNEYAEVIESLGDFIHPEYNLIKCLRKGVLYHHGGLPDIVRLFVEELYRSDDKLEVMISTSTLLEGINLPAQKLFILNAQKGRGVLDKSQFKNLVGRVSRFKDVFNEELGGVHMLEPEVHLMNGPSNRSNFKPLSFYSERANVSSIIKDKVKNPLLKETPGSPDRIRELEYLENIEAGSGLETARRATSEIGKLCFLNNVTEFKILENETRLNENLEYFRSSYPIEISDSTALLEAVSKIFLKGIVLSPNNENFERIEKYDQAKKFYSMFMQWRVEARPYKYMIGNFVRYWGLNQQNRVYIGSKWGEITSSDGFRKLWVDMSQKTESQKVNLAIAKIKEEQDFLEYVIVKFVEILNELGLIDESFYSKVKYGTDDVKVITLLKNGFSNELASILTDNEYESLVTIDSSNDTVHYDAQLIAALEQNGINLLIVFEAKSYL